jgi:DNA replication protein DnaC
LDWREGWRVVADKQTGLARAEALPAPRCPFCGGVGRREVELNGVLRVGKCRCQRVPDRVALFNAAGVPARHADCTLESFRTDGPGLSDARPVKTLTQRWLERFVPGGENRGLVIEGQPGRGKSHLLCAVVRELVFRHGVAVRFVEFTHLLSRLREGMDRNDGDATTLTPLVQVPVLAIDELGKGRKTDWELAIIDEIVTRRYNSGGVLLATTNFPHKTTARARALPATLATGVVESLEDRLGERVFSRMRETVDFCEAGGADYRQRSPLER